MKKALLAFVVVNGCAVSTYSHAFDYEYEYDEEETTIIETIVDNKETIAVAAISALILGYVSYKYGGNVIDYVRSFFARSNGNLEAVHNMQNDMNTARNATKFGKEFVYGSGYAQ